MPKIPTLTADQEAVVDCSVDSRVVVTAGPGAGKTYTLVSRIERLVTSDTDIAGQEVLSLSFSRAAVGELRRRLAALSSRGSRVQSSTFDSFATRILQTYGDSSLEGVDYDRRIELATDLIGAGAIEEINEIRHICIDEAQDLTGVRADFVIQLIKLTDCGFTVFADQAQAVYDFAGEVPAGLSFVERVTNTYKAEIKNFTLKTNHRTVDASLLAIASMGDLLRTSGADRSRVVAEFDKAVQRLPVAGSIGDAAIMLQAATGTALLTRRNSEALAISGILHAAGVRHQLRRRADDPVIGGWLSRLYRKSASRRVTLESLEDLTSLLPWNPNATWAALSRVSRPRKGAINLDQLAESLAARLPPDELLDARSDGVVVSTIHRAKGLEFDTVLLVPFTVDADDWLQEARVLYVGLTRARHNLMTLKRVDDGHWDHVAAAGRWRRVGFAGRRQYTTAVEVSGLDANTLDPTGAKPPREEPSKVQDYLLAAVEAGDPVLLERRQANAQGCIYDVTHDGQWVAATTPRFGVIITQRLGLKSPPEHINGCRVETVSTTALATPVAEVLGVKDQLVPNCRIQGVGTWS